MKFLRQHFSWIGLSCFRTHKKCKIDFLLINCTVLLTIFTKEYYKNIDLNTQINKKVIFFLQTIICKKTCRCLLFINNTYEMIRVYWHFILVTKCICKLKQKKLSKFCCYSLYIFMATFIGLIMNSKCQQTLNIQ